MAAKSKLRMEAKLRRRWIKSLEADPDGYPTWYEFGRAYFGPRFETIQQAVRRNGNAGFAAWLEAHTQPRTDRR